MNETMRDRMRRWDDVDCPACGSADIDLAETILGPLFACQECGHAFDPEDEFDVADPTVEEIPEAPRKPPCPLVGINGNVFNIISRVRRCLREDGQPERAEAWVADATSSHSYDEVLQKTFRYVDPM